LRVVPCEEDGVGEPAFVEIPCSLDGYGVFARVCEGNLVPAVGFKRDCAVDAHGFCQVVGIRMSKEHVMTAPIWLLDFRDGGVGEIFVGQWVIVTIQSVNFYLVRNLAHQNTIGSFTVNQRATRLP
jgi:hypothetical protein